jgi:hypothetical protein
MSRVQFSIIQQQDEHEALKRMAQDRDRSVAAQVRRIVAEALRREGYLPERAEPELADAR